MTSFPMLALQSAAVSPVLHKDPRLGCAPVSLATPEGPTRGMLITWAGDLVAVLGEVDDVLSLEEGWIVEFGLGPCETPPGGLLFDSLAEAVRWAESTCRELGPVVGLA